MSDGWFDRSYRSVETPPEDLDARILAAARRATRRWTVPAIAAGALTIAAVAVLGFLISGHELYVPPDKAARGDSATADDAFRIDVVQPSTGPERSSPPADLASPGMLREPGGIVPPDLQGDTEASGQHGAASSELDCRRSALIGPLGGPERRDLIQVCSSDDTLYIEVVWDGEPQCPSRLELPTPSDAQVSLAGRDLLVAETRYRCQEGRWIAKSREGSGHPSTHPLE